MNEIENNIINISLNEDENKAGINIFFCSKEKTQFFSDLKLLLSQSEKKFTIKGEFGIDSIADEVCYYLGIATKNHEEIDNKEIKNIIIFHHDLDDISNILKIFIEKIDSNLSNDEYPFFVFLKKEKNSFDFKKLILDLNDYQKEMIDSSKLDSRNIYIETEETIITTINKIYNYYNGDYFINFEDNDEDNFKRRYNITKTINILCIGKRGSGKSTLINRILGEKKAFAHINAKTPKTREYYHKYYPIKFIDSAGFEVDGLNEKKTNEIKDINKFLEDNNLDLKNINKKVHFIFYVFRANDKLDSSVIQILQRFESYNIETFFIITYSKNKEEKLYKNNFKEQIKQNKIFPKEKVNDVINNTFCIDSFDIKYSKTISDIFLLISSKLKEYEESNNIIIEGIENYKNLIKTEEKGYIIEDDEESSLSQFRNDNSLSTPLSSRTERLSIIEDMRNSRIFKKTNDPKEALEMIKKLIRYNIFMTDFETERENKKNLANQVIKNFVWPGFFWSSLMIPILNEYLAKKSKLKMLRRISEIYEIEIPDDYDKNFFNLKKEGDNAFKKIVKTIGTWLAGAWNMTDIKTIGNQIIEEFDFEYAKKNILYLYYDMAAKYNNSFQMIKDFYKCFNNDYWYDIRVEK